MILSFTKLAASVNKFMITMNKWVDIPTLL